jgi:hypothetical protein
MTDIEQMCWMVLQVACRGQKSRPRQPLASVRASLPLLALGFVVFCLVDLVRAEMVRYLPKWAWAIVLPGPRTDDPVRRDPLPGHREGPLFKATACTALSSA